MKGLLFGIFALLAATPAFGQDATANPPPVEVMVLGSFHFENPGQDIVNLEVDGVLAPQRQREIDILARALAQWQLTRVVVEDEAPAPGFELATYADADRLIATNRSESYQVGFRVARLFGHEAVYGFDERGGEGEPDYFPIDRVMESAAANGQTAGIEQAFAELQARVQAQQATMAQQSIAEALMPHNDAETLVRQHNEQHFGLMTIGDGNDQPGACLLYTSPSPRD